MSFFNQLQSGVAAIADKLDDPQPAAPAAAAAPAGGPAAAPAAAAAAAPSPAAAAPAAAPAAAAAAPAAPAGAAAPAAAAPAAPAAAAPVDIKATLMHAADAAKQGDYMGAVQDVMKTGLVQKFAASQAAKPHGDQAAAGAGSGDFVGNFVQQAEGLLAGAGTTGGAAGSNPLGSLLGGLGGSTAKPAGGAPPAAPQ